MEKKIQVVVDRIEGEIAVIELPDMDTIELHVKYLPDEVQEGNILDITFRINKEEETKRLKEISELQQELLNRNLK